MKYIDADLLREKISEQMESLPREVGRGAGTITSKGYGMMEAFQIVRSIIDSLQEEQQEVNYEKDLTEWMKVGPHTCYPWCTIPDAIKITAEHFYELGLNARKK